MVAAGVQNAIFQLEHWALFASLMIFGMKIKLYKFPIGRFKNFEHSAL